MTPVEFKAIMATVTTIPHTYYSYPEEEAPQLPYFVWYFAGSENFGADDVMYVNILTPVIELYTKEKSYETEKVLEDELNKYFFWNKNETYLTSEEMFQITYEIGDICNA